MCQIVVPSYKGRALVAPVQEEPDNGPQVEAQAQEIERLRGASVHGWLCLPPAASRLRARLFNLGAVVAEETGPAGEWLIEVRTSRDNVDLLYRREGLRAEWVRSGFEIPTL